MYILTYMYKYMCIHIIQYLISILSLEIEKVSQFNMWVNII